MRFFHCTLIRKIITIPAKPKSSPFGMKDGATKPTSLIVCGSSQIISSNPKEDRQCGPVQLLVHSQTFPAVQRPRTSPPQASLPSPVAFGLQTPRPVVTGFKGRTWGKSEGMLNRKVACRQSSTYIVFGLVQFFMGLDVSPRRSFRRRTSNLLFVIVRVLPDTDVVDLVLWILFCHHLAETVRKSTSHIVVIGITVKLFALAVVWALVRESPLGRNGCV